MGATLEIEADASGGVPHDVRRAVTENCQTLNFTSHGFEWRPQRAVGLTRGNPWKFGK